MEYRTRVVNRFSVLIYLESIASYMYTKMYHDPEAKEPENLSMYLEHLD